MMKVAQGLKMFLVLGFALMLSSSLEGHILGFLGGAGAPKTDVSVLREDTVFFEEETKENLPLLAVESDPFVESQVFEETQEIETPKEEIVISSDNGPQKEGEIINQPFLPEEQEITQYTSFQKGVNIYIDTNEGWEKTMISSTVGMIGELGTTHLTINIPIYTEGASASSVYISRNNTPNHELIGLVAQEARRLGMEVGLRPYLDEKSLIPSGDWRGTIDPDCVECWFESYEWVLTELVNEVVVPNGITTLYVGVELGSMQKHVTEWRRLINHIKEFTTAQLSYSIAFTNYGVIFWDELDFISVDVFFRHDHLGCTPTLDALQTDFAAQLQEMTDFYQEEWPEKPFVIAEVGTASEKCSFRAPFVWQHNTGFSEYDQALYVNAVANAVTENEQVAGLYWWTFDLYQRADEDTSFYPKQEAREVIKRWYNSYFP